MVSFAVITNVVKQSRFYAGLLHYVCNETNRANWIMLCALLTSLGLHLVLLWQQPSETQKSALSLPKGSSMALQLAPAPSKKPAVVPEMEELIVTKAPDALTQLQPVEEVPEKIPPKQEETLAQLEELVTREAQFSSRPVPPVYPEAARRKRQEGLVMVRAQVDDSGKTLAIKIAQSSGFPLLDKAALDAVRQWAFMPAIQNGKAIMAWIEVPVDFKLR